MSSPPPAAGRLGASRGNLGGVMARHYVELYRRDKPRKRRGGRSLRQLPVSTCVKAFVGISVLMAVLGAVLWSLGMIDFTAERGYLRLTGNVVPTRWKLSPCGAVFGLLPAHLESVRLCIALNVLPFTVLPLLVLTLTVWRVIVGRGDERD